MTLGVPLLVITTFLAAAVEAVETLTIILAVGVTRGWRSALIGMAAGGLALAAVVITLGPAVVRLVPLDALQVVVGTLLLLFGLQWLRKAVLRSAGLKSPHDEARIYQEQVRDLSRKGASAKGVDPVGFTVAMKAVFLEGLEVVFIVLTFGAANGGDYFDAALGAIFAVAALTIVGIMVHKPMTRVPENSIKFVVGAILIAFGVYWAGEGIGIEWALHEAMIVLLAVAYLLIGLAWASALRRGGAAKLEAKI
jgi:uncharacterized membrane protein